MLNIAFIRSLNFKLISVCHFLTGVVKCFNSCYETPTFGWSILIFFQKFIVSFLCDSQEMSFLGDISVKVKVLF